MPLTVTALQADLSGRCGVSLTAAGLDGSATSAAYLGPIARAARSAGVALASPLTAADADFAAAGVTDDLADQIGDVAELLALEKALQNYTLVDTSVSMGSQKLGSLRTDLIEQVRAKRDFCRARYGYGLGSPSSGSTDLGFAASADPLGYYP